MHIHGCGLLFRIRHHFSPHRGDHKCHPPPKSLHDHIFLRGRPVGFATSMCDVEKDGPAVASSKFFRRVAGAHGNSAGPIYAERRRDVWMLAEK